MSDPSSPALRCCLALLAAALCTAPGRAGAQTAPCPPAAAVPARPAAAPDVVVSASVQAAELRFETPPRAGARLSGCAAGDTVRVVERRNLPRPVQPGATYRDVYVSVEILGHLDAECLLRELGTPPDSTRPAGAAVCRPARADSASVASARPPAGGTRAGEPPRPQNPFHR